MSVNDFSGVVRVRAALIIVLASLLTAIPAFAQVGDFGPPLDMKQKLQLSSDFGRLRGNRFHAGLDFRTGGVEGVRVLAAKDGYIYRVGIKPYGYGKAVYVMHYDGTITVYAHLSRFTKDVNDYVVAEQYRRKANSIDLFPSSKKFPVKKGEVIGWSGNTGNSFGPHLHFEVRDAATECTVNPIAKGYYKIDDNVAPRIHAVCYYIVDTVSGVPFHTLAGKYDAVADGAGRYKLASPVKAPGKGYLTIETSDVGDNGFNMAAYRITESVDGMTRFEFVMEGFDFSQVPCARTVAQYAENLDCKNDIYRLAVQGDAGRLPFYGRVVNRGVIDPVQDREVEIEVSDDSGNTSLLKFGLQYAPEEYSEYIEVPAGAVVLDNSRDFVRSTEGLTVRIPARTLYEPLFYTQWIAAETPVLDKKYDGSVVSAFYEIHTPDVPIHSTITIEIDVDLPEELRDKVVLARVNGNGDGGRKLAAVSGQYRDGRVAGKCGAFGVWCAAVDTEAPEIAPSFKRGADMSKAKSLSFGIKDNLSGVASFSAEVDGQWVILEHNTVKNTATHYFDDSLSGRNKKHAIKLTVTDGVGNTSIYTGEYYR